MFVPQFLACFIQQRILPDHIRCHKRQVCFAVSRQNNLPLYTTRFQPYSHQWTHIFKLSTMSNAAMGMGVQVSCQEHCECLQSDLGQSYFQVLISEFIKCTASVRERKIASIERWIARQQADSQMVSSKDRNDIIKSGTHNIQQKMAEEVQAFRWNVQ